MNIAALFRLTANVAIRTNVSLYTRHVDLFKGRIKLGEIEISCQAVFTAVTCLCVCCCSEKEFLKLFEHAPEGAKT